jgi:hypothetical protein
LTAFVLIALGAALMLGAFALRKLVVPRFVALGVAVLGVVTTTVGAFRL